MQKKLIALAVAGLVSAPAFAQSNVTIYGVADAAMGFGSHGDNDFQGVERRSCRVQPYRLPWHRRSGQRPEGCVHYRAGFLDRHRLETTDGNAFQRQAFVGLGGSFGTVSLGRQYAPGYDFQYAYDAFGQPLFRPPRSCWCPECLEGCYRW
jgi:predicted porin